MKEAVWLWALKQTMEIAQVQHTQTLQSLTQAPAASEPGKGTLIDVKV